MRLKLIISSLSFFCVNKFLTFWRRTEEETISLFFLSFAKEAEIRRSQRKGSSFPKSSVFFLSNSLSVFVSVFFNFFIMCVHFLCFCMPFFIIFTVGLIISFASTVWVVFFAFCLSLFVLEVLELLLTRWIELFSILRFFHQFYSFL